MKTKADLPTLDLQRLTAITGGHHCHHHRHRHWCERPAYVGASASTTIIIAR